MCKSHLFYYLFTKTGYPVHCRRLASLGMVQICYHNNSSLFRRQLGENSPENFSSSESMNEVKDCDFILYLALF